MFDDFAGLHRVCELLERERLRRLAEIERRQLSMDDGHPIFPRPDGTLLEDRAPP